MAKKKINLSTCTPEEREQYWTDYAAQNLVGKTVTNVRYLTEKEMHELGWYKRCLVIEFSDGTLVFPSRDDEGNDAGSLFGNDPKSKNLTFPVLD